MQVGSICDLLDVVKLIGFHRRGLKEFHFWLFSDKLLYGQKLPLVGENYMLNREIPLSKCFVKLFDSVYDKNVTFMVQSPAKSFIVRLG